MGVIDSNNEAAIIEAKYFVMKVFYHKKAYLKLSFKAGHEQLNC